MGAGDAAGACAAGLGAWGAAAIPSSGALTDTGAVRAGGGSLAKDLRDFVVAFALASALPALLPEERALPGTGALTCPESPQPLHLTDPPVGTMGRPWPSLGVSVVFCRT